MYTKESVNNIGGMELCFCLGKSFGFWSQKRGEEDARHHIIALVGKHHATTQQQLQVHTTPPGPLIGTYQNSVGREDIIIFDIFF